MGSASQSADKPTSAPAKVEIRKPVIFDTDIGDDIDDSWALVMLLKSPQFDVKLITTDLGRQDYRARIIAKMLSIAGRTDIPIGLGAGKLKGGANQSEWVADYPLLKFPGKVETDGVGALINTINRSPVPITLIAIGPTPTIAAALERDPSIAGKVDFVGMQGSVYRGGQDGKPIAEYNVRADARASQKVLAAPWRSITITPLDTCGVVDLSGERYAKLAASDDALVKALLETYHVWTQTRNKPAPTASSILYDTVAVYLADPHGHPLLEMQTLKISVDAEGMMHLSESGTTMDVATNWKDLDGYRDHLVEVLLSK